MALGIWTAFLGLLPPAAAEKPTPTDRAVRYLSSEVPQWRNENPCFSCHNNGDAARALYTAASFGYKGLTAPLADTTRWLTDPPNWKNNGGDQRVSDKRLASIQFTSALLTAIETKSGGSRADLREAARILLGMQAEDGSWPISAAGSRGSPTTYGARLATLTARRALLAAGEAAFTPAIRRAEDWLLRQKPKNVFDAATALLALHDLKRPASDPAVEHAASLVRRGECGGGGWGLYVNSYPEPFDTAIVLLALNAWRDELDRASVDAMIDNGRGYLYKQQLKAGGWPETTRPAGGASYAEHISTTAWVTLALLETDAR